VARGRTLHVRCSTWEQVEAFHTRKLRRGKLLSMKVPFTAELGTQVTLGLELPNGVVIAIDGSVLKASPIEGDFKTWIEIELIGLTEDVLARIKALAAGVERVSPPVAAPPPPPRTRSREAAPPSTAPPVPADERELFQHLTAELRRLRQASVHEVLGVPRDAEPDQIRRAWMDLVRRNHPDLVVRHHAPAISHLAEELTIVVNRAYDRLRTALVAEGRATSVGSVLQQPAGWLVGFEDLSSVDGSPVRPGKSGSQPRVTPLAMPAQPPPPATTLPSNVQGGEAFEARARAMLGAGDSGTAQEVLAAALCVYPRSRPLRSLYYVATAIAALEKGELMLATSQLEAALAHHEQCGEAAALLEHIRKHGHARVDEMRGLFQ